MGRLGTGIFLFGIVLVATVGGLASWASSGNASGLVETAYDLIVKRLAGRDPMTRCWSSVLVGQYQTEEVLDAIDRRECYLEPRRFKGIYISEFEGGGFVPNASPSEAYTISICHDFWLGMDEQSLGLDLFANPTSLDGGQVFQVDFIGRPSPDLPQVPLPARYGHMGVYQNAIMVDRIISARLLRTFSGYSGTGTSGFISYVWPETSCDSPR